MSIYYDPADPTELTPLDAWRDDAMYAPLDSSEVALVHTDDHPFCSDIEGCPCHDDKDAYNRYILSPLLAGLLTTDEALRLYVGKQI